MKQRRSSVVGGAGDATALTFALAAAALLVGCGLKGPLEQASPAAAASAAAISASAAPRR